MDTGKISVRYAKALYMYAVDKKKEEHIYEEMKFVSEVFFLVPNLTVFLNNPRIPYKTKKELIISAMGSQISPELNRFLDLVMERKRESFFHFISLMYQDIYRKSKNIVIGKITTPKTINSKQEDVIKRMVAEKTGKSVDFASKIEPNTIGGFILQIGTYQMDASLATQLKKIKDSLLHKNDSE